MKKGPKNPATFPVKSLEHRQHRPAPNQQPLFDKFPIPIGATVAYSAAFLRSIGCQTGDLPAARGKVLELQQLGDTCLAVVQWDREGIPLRVSIDNLAIGGPNRRFCDCD